jgi:hypothetical protein
MPPVAPLSERQIEILDRWAVFGDVLRPERGEPDVSDRLPELESFGFAADGDGVVTFDYRVSDPDFDVVAGELIATPPIGDEITVTNELYSGRRTARWDTGVLEEGGYVVTAELDDGHRRRSIEVGEVAVVHPGGNRAPSPATCDLDRGEIIAVPSFAFSVAIDDDDPTVSVELFAVRGSESVALAGPVDVAPSSCTALPPSDLSALAEGVEYELRVVATDGGGRVREVRRPFVVGRPSGPPSFAGDIEPIFERTCAKCHKPEPLAPGGGAAFDEIEGAQSTANRIYRRVVLEETMPPRSAALVVADGFEPLTAAERALIAAWLLAGAPDN